MRLKALVEQILLMLELFIRLLLVTARLLLALLLLCLALHRGSFACAVVKLLIPLLSTTIIRVLVIGIVIRGGRWRLPLLEHSLKPFEGIRVPFDVRCKALGVLGVKQR